jgi:hypothetical protein
MPEHALRATPHSQNDRRALLRAETAKQAQEGAERIVHAYEPNRGSTWNAQTRHNVARKIARTNEHARSFSI